TLKGLFQVCAVETQGDVDGIAWVIDFYLSFSSDGASWSNFTYKNGTQVIFTRQGDSNYIDQETLPVTVFARYRYIRFHPISQHAWNTLRVEVYEGNASLSPCSTLLESSALYNPTTKHVPGIEKRLIVSLQYALRIIYNPTTKHVPGIEKRLIVSLQYALRIIYNPTTKHVLGIELGFDPLTSE
ncbi:uncharacterized protein, partial [Montipora foliosa]|uniref:uncharacterized protein n=1 Tax=Montipora foliosa TaxID=591990 RepID=UPI0035F1224A